MVTGCYATIPKLVKPPPAPARERNSVVTSDVVVIGGGGAPHQHVPLPQSAPILPCSADAPLPALSGPACEREQLLQLQVLHRNRSQGHNGQPPQFGLRGGDSAFLWPHELVSAAGGGPAQDLTESNLAPDPSCRRDFLPRDGRRRVQCRCTPEETACIPHPGESPGCEGLLGQLRRSASHSSISGNSTAGSYVSGCEADSGCAADEGTGPDCSSSSRWHGEAGSNAPDRGSEPCSRLGAASWHSLTDLASAGNQHLDARSWAAAEGPALSSLPALGSLSWAGGATAAAGDSGGFNGGAATSRDAAARLPARSHSLDSTDGSVSTRLRSSCFLGPPGGAFWNLPQHSPAQALALPGLASAFMSCWLGSLR